QKAGDHVEQSRLSTPARPDQGGQSALRSFKAHVIEHMFESAVLRIQIAVSNLRYSNSACDALGCHGVPECLHKCFVPFLEAVVSRPALCAPALPSAFPVGARCGSHCM